MASREPLGMNEAAGLLEEFAAQELGEEIEAGAETEDDRTETDDSGEETEELSESEESEADDETEETEETEEEETTEEPVYTVTIDGQPQQVTLQEALQGYQRQADYTRKTQSLADERRALDGDKAELRRTRDQYRERLELLEKAIEPQDEPDWDKVRAEKPDEYPRLYADWARRKAEHDKVARERERIVEEQRKDAREDYERYIKAETEKFLAAVPEWSDPATAEREKGEMAAYAQASGYSPEEIQSAADSRTLVLLRKAMLYDRLKAEKVTAKPKKDTVLKPGPKKDAKPKKSKAEQAHARLRKTGRKEDATAVFYEMLEGDLD